MRRGLAFLLLLPILACERPSLDASHAAAIRDSVRIMAEAIAQDLRAGGPNAWLPYFDPDPAFSMASDGRLVFPDIDSARAFVGAFAPGIARMELAWTDLRVNPVGPGLATMAAEYREVLEDTTGGERHLAGYFTALAVHTRAGWRLRHMHWSSPPAAP